MERNGLSLWDENLDKCPYQLHTRAAIREENGVEGVGVKISKLSGLLCNWALRATDKQQPALIKDYWLQNSSAD